MNSEHLIALMEKLERPGLDIWLHDDPIYTDEKYSHWMCMRTTGRELTFLGEMKTLPTPGRMRSGSPFPNSIYLRTCSPVFMSPLI